MKNGKELLDLEAEQLRKLAVCRQLIRAILGKYWIVLLVFFLLSLAVAIGLLARETKLSPVRYETRVNLLYFPRKSPKIQSLDDRNLMQIFTRYRMYLKLSDELHLKRGDILQLMPTIEVVQNRKQSNLYTIIARDNREDGAILKANTFADLCVREYIAFRSEDLKKHQDVIVQRKAVMQESLRQLQQEEAALCRNIPAVSPADELGRLQKISSDLKTRLTETEIQLANEKVKRKEIQAVLKEVNPAVFLHLKKIKSYISDLEKLDQELLSARQLYTKRNPRLLAMEAHRDAVAGKYEMFLKRNAVGKVNPETLGSLESLHREALKIAEQILQYEERRNALVKAIQINQTQTSRIQKVIPDFKRIEDRRLIVQESFRLNEEILSELSYLQSSLPNEVTQVERSASVVGKSLFAQKNLILALTAALLLAGLLTILIISLELIFGKVSGWRELTLYPELHLLGFLPDSLKRLGDQESINRVLDCLYYHFQAVGATGRIVFFGSLPGGEKSPEAEERLEWNYSLSGRKLFRLQITDMPVADDDDMALMTKAPAGKRSSGFFQVGDVYVIRTPELRLLQNILQKLQQEYDMIIISRDEPLKRNSIFLRQAAQFCDSAVFYVGARKTHRIMLRRLVNFAENNKMKIMTVVTGVKHVKPLIQREYYDV